LGDHFHEVVVRIDQGVKHLEQAGKLALTRLEDFHRPQLIPGMSLRLIF